MPLICPARNSYGGTFFDGDAAAWDSVTSDQVSGFGKQVVDGLESTGADSVCANIDNQNGEIASLWLQPANDATFASDENGCPDFTPARKRIGAVYPWSPALALTSGLNLVGGLPIIIENWYPILPL